ncbi:hypothetical protein K1T71_005811 [Dendrolimus kikuchii]|uniref:Uncharacterized protein n=1 Tax=Dendrolimus kikuchii TaxID=765133 RepID=A0ACC1D595_9NEOP|nr:hypothetical protein K1T71_005811 [Dendrolimus kikuchii]
MNKMKQIIVLICILKISQAASDLCSDYSVVFKYRESVPDQLLWQPLLPEDRNSPELKALFEKEKNCVLELNCDAPSNLTNIVQFTKEGTDKVVRNDEDSGSSGPEKCHIGSTSAACKESNEEKYTFVECDEIVNSSYSNTIKIKVIPDDDCKDDCFHVEWPKVCTDKKNLCKSSAKDKIIPDSTTNTTSAEEEVTIASTSVEKEVAAATTSAGEKVTDSTEVDNTTKIAMAGGSAAIGSGKSEETDLTALIVVAAIVGAVAMCALLFFGVKTVVAYFKSKSYNVGDAEATINQNRQQRDKYD